MPLHPWLNWIEHWISAPAVIGSNPIGCTPSPLNNGFFVTNKCPVFLNISAEDALRMTISKFEMRFAKVEKELKKRGKEFSDSNIEEMDEIWNRVKKNSI